MENLAENIAVWSAAGAAFLAALWMALKALKPVIKKKKFNDFVDESGKVLDDLDIVDADGDGK